ncbi:MAG: lipoyl synthase [Elusimicrobia bacterium RIFCSPLOWO2_01_FULL_60_11]|nr:MAG: lipoyl synthase [Elusimicrobia bacterium RIFCSPLOWO2_01_FULL_60_11]
MSLGVEYRQKIPSGAAFFKVTGAIEELRLNTVCEEAKCPNRTECYAQGTLTFQILGDLCTRRCGFCAEKTGRPLSVDAAEPGRVLEAVLKLKLSHVVLTAPARDDLSDGGASQFAAAVRLIKRESPRSTVETLTSDFEGNDLALAAVLESGPDVFNHNVETVRRLTPSVRAKATYERSLRLLARAAGFGGPKVKSGIMVGLGESLDEVRETFADLCDRGVTLVTVGQYLRPSKDHLPVQKFYSADEFRDIRKMAHGFPFKNVFAGPLVRSSYHAGEMIESGDTLLNSLRPDSND